MVSTNHLPISLSRSGRQYSRSTEISEGSHESGISSGSGELRPSRNSHSRTRESSQTPSHSRDGHTAAIRFSDDSPNSSEEDLTTVESATSRYGVPIRHTPGQYSLAPLDIPQPFPSISDTSATTSTAVTDDDLNSFVGRFRALVNQVSEETEAGMRLAQNDRLGYHVDRRTPSPNMTTRSGEALEDEDFFIVGGIVQRMPTIESLGSREVMSLATSSNSRGDRSIHSLSRPPTRQTMSILSDATGSQPPSRSNSLSASIILTPTSPLEGPFGGTASELGELQRPAGMYSASTHRPSTKSSSSGTFYSAVSAASATTGTGGSLSSGLSS